MTGRLGIDDVRPQVSGRTLPSKAVVGEVVPVSALVWREGHDAIAATLTVLAPGATQDQAIHMHAEPLNPDRVHGVFVPDEVGTWEFRVDAWSDVIATWRNAVTKKIGAGQGPAELANDLAHGVELFERAARQAPSSESEVLLAAARDLGNDELELADRVEVALSDEATEVLDDFPLRDLLQRGDTHEVKVERTDALFNSWYELFPRSTGKEGEHGTFATTADALDRVARMGFDTVYFPPIHPIGEVNRKGRNNSLTPDSTDVGSPWAIGSAAGGHDAVHPDLGTMEDFRALVARAEDLGLEVAIDFALQAAPDHPWATEHRDFFTELADGTIAYAENPPKKYQDIYPINFDNNPEVIYKEVYRVVKFWVDNGVRTFRVDNPHTKPANFWHWLIAEIHKTNPDVIFLAEAFTRPARLFGLAKAGFSQSYTYFTWKTTKAELTEFGEMIAEQADISRPNLFVNTPDILHESLQTGGRAMFAIRAVLAATMSPLWGVYSGYELYEHEAVAEGSEEYLDSEKYQIRHRDFDAALASGDSLEPFITTLNTIRREQPALQQLRTLHFHEVDNDQIIAYSKVDPLTGNTVLVVVNLDPDWAQEGTVHVDFGAIGREPGELGVHDLITGSDYTWGEHNFVRLEPKADVAHVFVLQDVPVENRERVAWREISDYRG
ncbi:alpha-1,4-glucan--maltose-1-phosphate maltosyltransferase [Corynebacterium doosanense]|uniref:Alpha-1,4-glucan:maltose-1-phosphate maltosyltransferase n=1 Tax=Corynebacterium doosanense CAU 212 = DSM 45436 TaxID=558173 RepID=A0A097IFH5_9CORY|nr:alpha-1,4-glucan--maltose-1-phosphate maltosyltransferase [Corynebacterium doosanense]AIT60865.1 alpha-1,4-glucan:maltose-1-phosphate maltosyltransferase [Corynebacterium doosanense CAU 212 = DSM 45436]